MRVTIFTAFNTALNPYIILFKEALEGQGVIVRFERNFNLHWLLFRGKSCDCIHLHWIKHSYSPPKNNDKSKLLTKLIEIRLVRILLDLLCLIDFALAFLFAKLAGKIIVFTVHDLYEFGEKSFRGKLQLETARNIVFRFSDAIHAHNHFTRKLVETRYKRKTGISVIPHGNYIGYYENQVSRSEARSRLKLPDDSFVYLFLGLLRPYKGLEDLISAFKKLESSKVRLLVAGRVFGVDNYEAELKELVRVDPRIRLVPEFIVDEEIQLYLNACDMFVLPYKDITTSGAAALALSFGRPIIAPAIASFPEVVTPESGILYDPSNLSGLALALQEAGARTWSESKIFKYAHQLDWDKLGPQLITLYRVSQEKNTEGKFNAREGRAHMYRTGR